MARGKDADSATSDFFICINDQPELDWGGEVAEGTWYILPETGSSEVEVPPLEAESAEVREHADVGEVHLERGVIGLHRTIEVTTGTACNCL